MKAIVIGAGVVGASVAYRLAQAGVSVTVLEAERVGAGTSGISFAWTNSNSKAPRSYHDLNVAGMQAHAALQEEFGRAPWFHRKGCLEFERSEDGQRDLAAKVERLRAWGYPAEWIGRDRLLAMEPDLDPAMVPDVPIAWYPDDGWLDPVVYANAMIKAAQGLGAELRCGVRVAGLLMRGDRVAGVRTADGATVEADMVVNCAGRWSDKVGEDPGIRLPLAPTIGFLVFTPPVATSVDHLVLTPDINLRPDGAGRLMLHKKELDDLVTLDMTPLPTMPEAAEVMARAAELIPALARVRPEAARIAVRPIPKDGLSAIGPVPRVEGYYLVVTHSGVTLSPFLAKAVADEIAGGKLRSEFETVRPARFFN